MMFRIVSFLLAVTVASASAADASTGIGLRITERLAANGHFVAIEHHV